MEKTLSEEEKQRINILLEKHQPREEIQGKEMVVLSEKGEEISIKTEVASSSMKPFEDQPIEYEKKPQKENMKSLVLILRQNMKRWILKMKNMK